MSWSMSKQKAWSETASFTPEDPNMQSTQWGISKATSNTWPWYTTVFFVELHCWQETWNWIWNIDFTHKKAEAWEREGTTAVVLGCGVHGVHDPCSLCQQHLRVAQPRSGSIGALWPHLSLKNKQTKKTLNQYTWHQQPEFICISRVQECRVLPSWKLG